MFFCCRYAELANVQDGVGVSLSTEELTQVRDEVAIPDHERVSWKGGGGSFGSEFDNVSYSREVMAHVNVRQR